MKALITGPRSNLTAPGKNLSFIELEIDLEELPKVGETIFLNSGLPYVVDSVMWWVQAPTDDTYWDGGDYKAPAKHEIVHVNVLPPGMSRSGGYPAGREDGRREAVKDLADLLALTGALDGDSLRSLLSGWVAKETATAATDAPAASVKPKEN